MISAPNAAFYVAKLCADSSESCFNVTNSAQRTIGKSTRIFRAPRPCVAHRKRKKFAASSRISAPKICAISAPNAAFCVAKRCADSNENCIDVRKFAQRTIRKSRRNFRAPRPKTAKIMRRIQALSTKIFLRVRRRTRHFSIMNATPTPLRVAPTL